MKNQKRESNGCAGFSLIELVFAMTFLTIIILGVVTLQSSNLAMMNSEKNRIQAEFLANEGIQIAKAIGYSAIGTVYSGCADPCLKKLVLSGSDYSLSSDPPEITPSISNQVFDRTIQIISDNTNLPNAYRIKAIVEWEDSAGRHYRTENGQEVNAHVEASLIVSQ